MADHVSWEGLSTNVAAFQTPLGFTSDGFPTDDVGDQTAFSTGFADADATGKNADPGGMEFLLKYQDWNSGR